MSDKLKLIVASHLFAPISESDFERARVTLLAQLTSLETMHRLKCFVAQQEACSLVGRYDPLRLRAGAFVKAQAYVESLCHSEHSLPSLAWLAHRFHLPSVD